MQPIPVCLMAVTLQTLGMKVAINAPQVYFIIERNAMLEFTKYNEIAWYVKPFLTLCPMRVDEEFLDQSRYCGRVKKVYYKVLLDITYIIKTEYYNNLM